jgi:exopolysaccharide biosynthesis polyprenyl glycosylphosphotransferase
MIMQFFFTYAARLFITSRALKKIWNHEWYKGIIIIGAGEKAKKLQYELSGSEYKIIGFVNESVSEKSIIEEAKIIGNIKDLPGIIKDNNIDEIIVATESEDTVKLLYSLYHFRRPIKILIEKNDLLSKVKIKNVYDIPLIDVTENNFSEAERNVKWLIDKIISFFVLIICLPLYIYISLRVKKDSKGPVFFSQERIGFHGKPFRIYKFRTMYVDAENQGALLTAKDDIRVTRFGRFLRKYRLDEMPQFWNVLKGDMSLVGPRPEQRYYIKQIVQKAPYYYLLHNVRPGITSLGMVKYGYAESVDKMIERLDYDVLYYENMSLAMDLTILVYTIKTVFTGKGI